VTPEEAAEATASAVSALSSHFMLDGATYAKGAEMGFDGMDFYVAGRGGVLGDVDGDVVSAAFVFFEPGTVRQRWESSRSVMSRADAGAAFARCGHEWATEHLPDDIDWARLADLTGEVVAQANPAAAPVFAGWRRLPVPEGDVKARALHQMNALRELRMAMHGAAVVTAGIAPLEALMVRTPYMAGLFGWDEPHPDPEPVRAAWEQAEAATNRGFATHLAALDEGARKELVRLLADAQAATG
jgi:hypothetical protein